MDEPVRRGPLMTVIKVLRDHFDYDLESDERIALAGCIVSELAAAGCAAPEEADELDAARAEVAALRAENAGLRAIGLAALAYSESTRDRAKGDPNLTWRALNDVLAYEGSALDAAPAATTAEGESGAGT